MQIEKDIEFDHPQRVYPFAKMEVGESFYFDGDAAYAKKVRSASANFTSRKSRNGWRFSTLKYGDGYRCKRIA